MTRVLLVDDHPIVLSGLQALVESDPDLEVAASARSVSATLDLPDTVRPDIAVLDLHLPDGDGIALGISLKRRWPAIRVMVLTMSDDTSAVLRSLGAGLDGYVLKESDPADLLSAVHAVAGGALVIGRGASGPVAAAAASAPRTDPLAPLDARDLEILALLTQGLTTTQVAGRLFLAPKTIRNRISEIIGKLGVASRDDAIDLARAGGLGTGTGPPRS